MDINADVLANAIDTNCEAYDAGLLTREEWSAEQNRLWKLASDRYLMTDVLKRVCPSLGARVPPYTVRKQLREQTLAVCR